MIKAKDLEIMTSWNSMNDLEMMRKELKDNINSGDYLVSIEYDKIVEGTLFNAKEYDCIKIYHPEYPTDYFYYCIFIKEEKGNAVAHVCIGGKSKQLKLDDYLKSKKIFDGTITKGIKEGAAKGGSFGVGWAVGGVALGITKAGVRTVGKGIAALMRDKEAIASEESWYSQMQELIGSTFYIAV